MVCQGWSIRKLKSSNQQFTFYVNIRRESPVWHNKITRWREDLVRLTLALPEINVPRAGVGDYFRSMLSKPDICLCILLSNSISFSCTAMYPLLSSPYALALVGRHLSSFEKWNEINRESGINSGIQKHFFCAPIQLDGHANTYFSPG